MKDYSDMNLTDQLHKLEDSGAKVWRWLLWTGIIMMILGLGAILLPFIATLTIEAILAGILILAGATQLVHAFKSQQPKGSVLRLFAAALYILVGALLLSFPRRGVLTLTLLLAVMFAIVGTFKIALSLHLRPFPSWGWLMVSGIVALVLGTLIWIGLPGTAGWAIGLLVGIELLFSGWSMIIFASSVHSDYEARNHGKQPP